jgi:hypothetical protein
LGFAVLLGASLRYPDRMVIWFLAAGTVLAGGGYFGAYSDKIALLNIVQGARYAYAPQIMFLLALLSLVCAASGNARRFACGVLIWVLAVQTIDNFRSPSAIFEKGPDWKTEVGAWERDPDHALAIWPVGWSFQLCGNGPCRLN